MHLCIAIVIIKLYILNLISIFPFAEQCTPLKHDIVFPINKIFLTQSRLNSLDFNKDKILKIIRTSNINKARNCDDISIRIMKICDKSLTKPLIILSKNSTKSSYYPDIWRRSIWRRSNVIPVHKKNEKKKKNSQLIATDQFYLSPIIGKFFEVESLIEFTTCN